LRLTALITVLVGIVGAAWSWKLLQWYISANSVLYCVLGSQCASVFASASSYFYGTPIHLLAVGWFSLLTIIAGIRAYGVVGASRIGLAVGALCVPTIIYLDYIMVGVIHAICSDCELAHILGLIVFGLFVVMYRSDRKSRENES
jgi:uncharacterized membrane protein